MIAPQAEKAAPFSSADIYRLVIAGFLLGLTVGILITPLLETL
jgi:hypothetical protein